MRASRENWGVAVGALQSEDAQDDEYGAGSEVPYLTEVVTTDGKMGAR